MSTATWSATADELYQALQYASQYNNQYETLGFAASDITTEIAQILVDSLLDLNLNWRDTFEPYGSQLERWANEMVPVVIESINGGGGGVQFNARVTENSQIRVTESGDRRILED